MVRLYLGLVAITLSLSSFTIQAQLYESFEGIVFPPAGWTTFTGANSAGIVQDWRQSGSAPFHGNFSAFVQYEQSPASVINEDWLVTKAVNLTGTGNVLTFNGRDTYTGTYGSLYYVLISTTSQTNITSFDTLATYTEVNMGNASGFKPFTIDLSAYDGQTVYLAFMMASNYQDDWYLDNVYIGQTTNCPPPDDITGTPLSATEALLEWTASSTSHAWKVEYGSTGFLTGAGTIIPSGYDTLVLSGLTPQTTYDFYVKDSCTTGNKSAWVGPYTFTTLCLSTPQVLPFLENFNAGLGCFTVTDGGNTIGTWSRISTYNGNQLDGTGFAFVNASAGSFNSKFDEVMTSPFLDASTVNGDLVLEFDQYYNYYASDTGIVEVFDGTQWVKIYQVTGTDHGAWANPEHIMLNVSTYANSNFRIRFRYKAGWDYWWAIDNISVMDVSCVQPLNVSVKDLGPYTADIFWASNALNWNVEYDTTGFVRGTGRNTTIAGNDTISLTGLIPQTSYDMYIRSNCGVNDTSAWTGPFMFTTTVPCPDPSNVAVTDINSTSAKVSWQGPNAVSWTLIYGFSGFNPATGGISVSVSSIPHSLTGLISDSDYDVYVISDCGIDGTSDTTGPIPFTTPAFCPRPVNIEGTNLTSSSIVVFWQGPGIAQGWNVEYGPSGFTQGTGTIAPVFNDTLAIGGLLPHTSYDVYVQSNCNPGFSLWEGPFTFTTLCLPQPLPFVENFNNGLECFIPMNGGNTSHTWQQVATYSGSSLNGSGFAFANSADAGSTTIMNEILTSPVVDASAISYNLVLEFDHYFRAWTNNTDTGFVDIYDGTQWVNVYMIEGSSAGAWSSPDHQFIDVTSYANAGFKVRFRYKAAWDYYWAVDNISIKDISCTPSTGPVTRNISTDSASIHWTAGTANTHLVEYGPSGFTPGSGALVVTTDTFVNVGNLTPGIWYEAYVIDSCLGTYDTVGVVLFKTLCLPQNLSYSENFNIDLGCMIAVDSGNTIATWFQLANYNGSTLDGTGFAFVSSSASGTIADEELMTPSVDAAVLSGDLILEFDQYIPAGSIFFPNNDAMAVEVYNGSQWVNVYTANGSGISVGLWSSPDHQRIDVTAHANANFKVRFVYQGNYGYYWAIDNLLIHDVTCPAPDNPGAMNITATSADLFWNSGGASYWNIEYDTSGFALGTGNSLTFTNDTSAITGLLPNTTYCFYVRDSCGTNNVSLWAGPYCFTTGCLPFTAPFYESFEDNSSSVTCWQNEHISGIGNWTIGTGSLGGAVTTARSGTKNARFTSSSGGPHITRFVSPIVDLTGLQNPRLSFSYAQENWGTGYQNYLNIYSRTSLSATWTLLYSDSTHRPAWVDTSLVINASGSTFQLAFEGVDNWGRAIAIDSIVIDETPSVCIPPSDLTLSSAGCDSVVLTWTPGTTGGFSLIAYDTAGFIPGNGTLFFSSAPATITGLDPGTSYDVYIANTCGADTSAFAGPVNFTTLSGVVAADFSFTVNPATLVDQTVDFDALSSIGGSAYSWDFGDGSPVETGITTSHTYSADGTYYVVLTITGNCGTDTASDTVTIAGIGLAKNLPEQSLELYPNPAGDKLNIIFPGRGSSTAKIRVLDMSGKLIHSEEPKDINGVYHGILDIRYWPAGIYMVEVHTGDQNIYRRIVKQ